MIVRTGISVGEVLGPAPGPSGTVAAGVSDAANCCPGRSVTGASTSVSDGISRRRSDRVAGACESTRAGLCASLAGARSGLATGSDEGADTAKVGVVADRGDEISAPGRLITMAATRLAASAATPVIAKFLRRDRFSGAFGRAVRTIPALCLGSGALAVMMGRGSTGNCGLAVARVTMRAARPGGKAGTCALSSAASNAASLSAGERGTNRVIRRMPADRRTKRHELRAARASGDAP